MEREFTNALSNTPLWRFALRVYSDHQSTLLNLQDQYGANVNELLALAFAKSQNRGLRHEDLDSPILQRLRTLIQRVRTQRRISPRDLKPLYQSFELELEGCHLQLLDQQVSTAQTDIDHQILLETIRIYEKQMGMKKGTLVPFIRKLTA